ncbi:MAG TPA: alpha/beta hydrolase [Chitinophagaceae bacterium]|jgi:acetyl esterase/lipase|nr:alpha/beta hydrolase [Chitinophagaceae bacterium]
MKNIILILFCNLTIVFSIAQNANQLYRKADSLYTLKDFKNAAVAYNEGIKLQGSAAGFNRYISAASSWAMANSSDSAFYILDKLSKNDKLTPSDYKNIESAKELATLQSDKRWKPLLATAQKQAEGNTYPQEEFVYGRKDGMGLLMTQLKPKVKSNGKAIISVQAGSWFSNFTMVERGVYYKREYLDKGYNVFMVVLGSQPRYAIPDQVDDLKRAVRYIRYNAKQLGIDPDHIGIEGGSAGGHLSLLIATADEKINANASDPVDRVSSRVQAAAVLFPPTDFFNWGFPGAATINQREVQKQLRVYGAFDFRVWNNSTLTYDPVTDTAARNKIGKEISPIYAVSSDDPPIFIIHGDADMTVPVQQSQTFVAKLKEAGVTNNYIIKKGGRHNPDDMKPELDQFVDWFDKYLK